MKYYLFFIITAIVTSLAFTQTNNFGELNQALHSEHTTQHSMHSGVESCCDQALKSQAHHCCQIAAIVAVNLYFSEPAVIHNKYVKQHYSAIDHLPELRPPMAHRFSAV